MQLPGTAPRFPLVMTSKSPVPATLALVPAADLVSR